jgi:hypothetical protein
MLWPCRGSMRVGVKAGCGWARPKDLGTLDGSRGGLILPRRVKAACPTFSSGIGSNLSPSLEGVCRLVARPVEQGGSLFQDSRG